LPSSYSAGIRVFENGLFTSVAEEVVVAYTDLPSLINASDLGEKRGRVQMAVASATRAQKTGTRGSLVSHFHPLAQSPENSPQSNSWCRGNVVKNLFVGNLGSEVTHEELRRLFEAYGQVVQVHIIVDRDTGLPRGFAFVEMTNDGEAEKAIRALNGSMLRDRTLDVSYARPRPERPAA